MTSRAETLAQSSIQEQFPPGVEFSIDKPMDIEMLSKVNPDYCQFRNLSHIHPLVWGIQDNSPRENRHVIAFLGPSSAGRDTILRDLQDLNVPFKLIVTDTTRTYRKDPSLPDIQNFKTPEEFKLLLENNEFIEHVLQVSGNYGTEKKEVENAIASGHTTIIWKGEESGLSKMWEWFITKHPKIERHAVFLLPNMPFIDLTQRIIEKRNPRQIEGRVEKAAREIIHAGSIADYIILNPPQPEGPVAATEATRKLFTYLTS